MNRRLTVEQEAEAVLEQMARLKRENEEATVEEREILRRIEARLKAQEVKVANINAERDVELAVLEKRAKGLGLRAEGTIKTEFGTVKFRAGYARVTYDAKGLDAAAKTPEHGWLTQYRTEKFVPPSATVKMADDG